MAFKNVIMKRKIANEIFELLPKTSDAQVEVTYGSQVQALSAALSTIYTDIESWKTFKANVDFSGSDSALDTLRELIDMISDEQTATSIAGQLSAIRSSLTTLGGSLETLSSTVTTLSGTVTTLSGTVASNKTELEEAISDLSDTVTANKTETDAAIAAIQTVQAGLSRVLVSSTVPNDLTENDLLMQIIEDSPAPSENNGEDDGEDDDDETQNDPQTGGDSTDQTGGGE